MALGYRLADEMAGIVDDDPRVQRQQSWPYSYPPPVPKKPPPPLGEYLADKLEPYVNQPGLGGELARMARFQIAPERTLKPNERLLRGVKEGGDYELQEGERAGDEPGTAFDAQGNKLSFKHPPQLRQFADLFADAMGPGIPKDPGIIASGIRFSRGKVKAPAVVRDEAKGATEKIFEHAAEQRSPRYPTATEPVFKTGPDDLALTKELTPQVSRYDEIPRPTAQEMETRLPAKDRSRPIVENTEGIADLLARDLGPRVAAKAPSGTFYHTGPVTKGIADITKESPASALEFIREWAGQGAGTSMRTKTPQNLRNAAYLQYRRAQGEPFTPERFQAEGNRPGFGMMEEHTRVADDIARGVLDINRNPKPDLFQGAWSGNLRNVVGDTHNIRSTLSLLDEIVPGGIPREWFKSDDAFNAYRQAGGFAQGQPLPRGIKDTLEGVTRGGRNFQTEYGVMTEPWHRAAQKLDVDPSDLQSHGWFHYGDRTGLGSPNASIPDLLNSQIEATARATGLHPEKIIQLFRRGRIPLAATQGADTSAVG